MKRVVDYIKVDMARAKSDLNAIVREVESWPDDKKEAFANFWYEMHANGAEVGETLFKNGVLYCAISDDLRRAVAEWGRIS